MMKKSKRLLSLLLCLVMVAALMPTFAVEAKADDSSAVRYQNEEIKNQKILRYKKEYHSEYGDLFTREDYYLDSTVQRHSVEAWDQIEKIDGNVLDRGYKDSNIFLFPQGNGAVSFAIERNQVADYRGAHGTTDVNRWWRWGSRVDGMTANIKGWSDSYAYTITDSPDSKEMNFGTNRNPDNHWCYNWTGGPVSAARVTEVQIDTNLPVGTKSELWSANGTNYSWRTAMIASAEATRVLAGDISKHTFTVAKSTSVVYYLNGGSYAGNGGDATAPVGFYCWSTNDIATSQLHDIMQAPTREGYAFLGWECIENGGNPNLKVGNIYQPFDMSLYNETVASSNAKIHSHSLDGKESCIAVTDDIKFKAVWAKDLFEVVHVRNGVEAQKDPVKMTDVGKYVYVAYDQPLKYVPNDNGYDLTAHTSEGYLYGGAFTEAACDAEHVLEGNAKALTPKAGAAYYIWEVTDEHLQPTVLSTYDRSYKVAQVFLVSAVDRNLYQEAGFMLNNNPDDLIKTYENSLYSYILIKSQKDSSATQKANYALLNSKNKTAANALLSCAEIAIPESEISAVPYWVTLDGQTIYGTKQCAISYSGSGPALSVSFGAYPTVVKALAPVRSFAAAPMMLMSSYSMGQQESPAEIPDAPAEPETPDVPEIPDEPEVKAMLNVVDGDKAYEVEISDDMSITPAGANGKLFGGWFADEGCTIPADISRAQDGDTVYAKYVSDKYLQVKYSAVFSLLSKSISLTSAVDSKDYAETGYVISTKDGDKTVVVSKYAATFALQNAKQLFGVAKNAPLMNAEYKLSGIAKNDKVTVTPYMVTADGTTVYGTARTLTYTGLTMKG